jgi:serine/threonine protein phosphatase PrpC
MGNTCCFIDDCAINTNNAVATPSKIKPDNVITIESKIKPDNVIVNPLATNTTNHAWFHANVNKNTIIDRVGSDFYIATTAEMIGCREKQEDVHCVYDDKKNQRHVFGVFDGHGGDMCSKFMAKTLPQMLTSLPQPLTPNDIQKAFISADKMYINNNDYILVGSCAAIVIVEKMTARVAHIGDSCVMIMRDNKIIHETRNHKPNDPIEHKRIIKAGLFVSTDNRVERLAVSRAFGDSHHKIKYRHLTPFEQPISCVPDISNSIVLMNGDIIIIHCDGVNEGGLTSKDVCGYISNTIAGKNIFAIGAPDDLATASVAVCDEAIRKYSHDNITCMIVKIGVNGTQLVKKFGSKTFIKRS